MQHSRLDGLPFRIIFLVIIIVIKMHNILSRGKWTMDKNDAKVTKAEDMQLHFEIAFCISCMFFDLQKYFTKASINYVPGQ